MTRRRRRWTLAIGLTALACVLTVGVLAGRGPAAALCLGGEGMTNYDRMPEPAPGLDDGDVLRVGDRRSVFLGMGRPLDADHRLPISDRRVLDQVDTTFAETERRCGRVTRGYRFVTVRAVAPGETTVGRPAELRVRVTG